MELYSFSPIVQNVLIASILGDGEITKIYPGSRRKNNSYREHFSSQQLPYRVWKLERMPSTFYFNQSRTSLLSPSLPLLTEMFPHFYHKDGHKIVSEEMLDHCRLPLFLTTLYMDDGSLSISVRKNSVKKLIYLTPHVYLYLQSFNYEDLLKLKKHIREVFMVEMETSKRREGYGHVLKTTKVCETMKFLAIVEQSSRDCPSMRYKTCWDYRLEKELSKYRETHSEYKVIVSSSERNKAYTRRECELLQQLKSEGLTDKEIAETLGRTYWSIVYKWRELSRYLKK